MACIQGKLQKGTQGDIYVGIYTGGFMPLTCQSYKKKRKENSTFTLGQGFDP